MTKKLKVYGWTGMSTYPQSRNIVAAYSVAEVLRITGMSRHDWNNGGDETGNDEELSIALAEPRVVFYQPLNARQGDNWHRLDGSIVRPVGPPKPNPQAYFDTLGSAPVNDRFGHAPVTETTIREAEHNARIQAVEQSKAHWAQVMVGLATHSDADIPHIIRRWISYDGQRRAIVETALIVRGAESKPYVSGHHLNGTGGANDELEDGYHSKAEYYGDER